MKRLTAEQLVKALRRAARKVSGKSDLAAAALDEAASAVREHLTETDEQRRERFERWCESNLRRPVNPIRQQDGRYMDCVVQQWFEIWQAALTWHGETEGGGA